MGLHSHFQEATVYLYHTIRGWLYKASTAHANHLATSACNRSLLGTEAAAQGEQYSECTKEQYTFLHCFMILLCSYFYLHYNILTL
ncbi:Uncharacterised protein [Segatella copri]|nr:Uncharacterised protein [Segatella copri]